ncbi:MAG TPA: galactokinase [Candidatus Limnocylindrales bacterium]|nr:galactokinase [Candidatus Limnocylindrales bacterium]
MIEPGELADRLSDIEPTAAADPGSIVVVHAPGRVNLIGEHTDYNEGYVLPIAIDRGIAIAFVPTQDRRVTLTLAATDETTSFDLDAIAPRRGHWIDYVAGTAWAMAEAGLGTQGFRGVLGSDLPQGAGLSSSAALELASALALSGGTAPTSDLMQLARIAQRAENGYVGVQSGLMDPFASAHGREGAALLLDCRSLEYRPVTLGLDDVALVVADSGSPRRLDRTAYNERRAQCEAAVAAIARTHPGVRSLRDVTPAMLADCAGSLEPALARRAQHVVEEDTRVLEAAAAMEAREHARVGELLLESHASLRDLYEVSSPELDALVDTAMAVDGVFGARLTGAGFGGCTVDLVRRDAIDRLSEAISTRYAAQTGLVPRMFEVLPSTGARRVDGWH